MLFLRGSRLLDYMYKSLLKQNTVILRFFFYIPEHGAYLHNSYSLQQSTLLPSGLRSQTQSTCGAYQHPEHQGSDYRFRSWYNSSWNHQRTSYTISEGEENLCWNVIVLWQMNIYSLNSLYYISNQNSVDLLTRTLHLLRSVDAVFLSLP